jgi:two-component system phosphate regulon sensor histidine kinase PhoR
VSPEFRALAFALARLAILLAIGAMLGLLLGRFWIGLTAVLAAALAWHLVNLFRLDWWLRDRSARDPPDVGGLWGDVVTQVVRLHRRKRYHKQRLLQLFREIRRSTAAMSDGVVVLNQHAEILWFNRMAARLLGLRRKADLGIRIGNLVRQPEFLRYLGHGDFTTPLIVSPRPGAGNALAFQVVPYGGDQLLVLVRDVTRQVQLENLRRDFVANASHELRAPLTVISGYLETLEQDVPEGDPLKPPLQEMRRQAERMTAIVRDLLELSRLDANEDAAGAGEIDVEAMISLLRKDVLARARHPRVALRIDTGARLRGEESEIQSAFANLVDNAVKYTPPDGEITLRWWLDGNGEACFTVSDTGVGIAAEHLPRLTERFYRVDQGRARSTGGSGLGLAIVKHVLQHHAGRLVIDSAPGEGSHFTCRFPPSRVLWPAREASIPATGGAGGVTS